VSDLPRFFEGKLGRLDFTVLNEAFRRLDILRPLIEQAEVREGGSFDLKPDVLLVYANRLNPEQRYQWREVFITEDDEVKFEFSPEEEEEKTEILASSQFRRGGQPYNEDEADEDEEDLSEDYAILLDQTNDWDSGFALLVVMRRVDAVNRYVLVPVGVGGGGGDTAVFKVSAGIGETTITLGDAGDVTAYEYRGDLCVRSNGQWTSTADSVCYDLSFNAENHPANRDAFYNYSVLDVDTCLTVSNSGGISYFGAPCRLEWGCA